MHAERKSYIMRKRKYRIIILTLILLICTVVSFVVAKYVKSSNKLGSSFEPAVYDTPIIVETVSTDTDGFKYKTDVRVTAQDNGYPVYVRASFIVTWQDSNGNVLGTPPAEGTDYSIEYNDTDWTYNANDGYYYYKNALSGGDTTFPLIGAEQKLKQLRSAPAGYAMNIEILAQTIQAVGNLDTNDIMTAVYEAWGVQPDN